MTRMNLRQLLVPVAALTLVIGLSGINSPVLGEDSAKTGSATLAITELQEKTGENEVWLVKGQIYPRTLEIMINEPVYWYNRDEQSHSLRLGTPANPSNLSSGKIVPGGSFKFVFTKAGTNPYFCEEHHGEEGMARIVVKDSTTP